MMGKIQTYQLPIGRPIRPSNMRDSRGLPGRFGREVGEEKRAVSIQLRAES
jgi:hypothetical protein